MAQSVAGAHPLSMLTPDELSTSTQIIRSDDRFREGIRFVTVSLLEPSKDVVLGWTPGNPVPREVKSVLYDRPSRTVIEVVVSLDETEIRSWREIPNASPSMTVEEWMTVPDLLKADSRWQEAMRKRGITNYENLHIDPWGGAYLGPEHDRARRLCFPLTYVRTTQNGNGYAHPIDGLTAVVDVAAMEVVDVTDHDLIPIPEAEGEYVPELAAAVGARNRPQFAHTRDDVAQIAISEPDGVSWEVDGNCVEWQKWSLTVGWSAREGLILHDIRYDDRGRLRPVVYRASLSEMVVPYGDPSPTQVNKLAFDAGEVGLGLLVSPLRHGCDCLGVIHYFDGLVNDSDGAPAVLENAICMHEEDVGIAWKHLDPMTGVVEVRRMQRLVISAIANIGNYDYGFFWYLYQDGSIELDVKLTGILQPGAYRRGEPVEYGTPLTPDLYAPNHQHYFCARLDMNVDGLSNTVTEVNTESVPKGPGNPYGNAWRAVETPLKSEAEAQRTLNFNSARFWRVTNPNRLNENGRPIGYRLVPGGNTRWFNSEDSPMIRRGAFATKHLWVTPFAPDELYAAGDYPWQNPDSDGLPRWTQEDRNIENTDLVVWYVFGAHHVPRVEEWPVMPVANIGFGLQPDGFFDGNPALDLPRPQSCAH
jgi:primary-amine oxidase